jgi:hypothetical protein
VRLRTVQDAGAVRRARAPGRLSGGLGACPWPEDDADGRRACAWMRARMAERISGFSGAWPVWAWANRPSWRRPRPGHVLLSGVVPAARVLWSDYALRPVPLNGGPLVADAAAWDAWEACLDVLGGGLGPWSRASGIVQGCCDGLFWAEVRHVARAGAGLLADGSAEGVHGA